VTFVKDLKMKTMDNFHIKKKLFFDVLLCWINKSLRLKFLL